MPPLRLPPPAETQHPCHPSSSCACLSLPRGLTLPQSAVLYARYTTPSRLISERDFINLTYWVVDADGTIFISAVSIEHPKAPPVPGAFFCLFAVVRCAAPAVLLLRSRPRTRSGCCCSLFSPPVAGCVRADVKLGGWVLKPNAAGTSCMATYLMETDLCGSIPGAIVKARGLGCAHVLLKRCLSSAQCVSAWLPCFRGYWRSRLSFSNVPCSCRKRRRSRASWCSPLRRHGQCCACPSLPKCCLTCVWVEGVRGCVCLFVFQTTLFCHHDVAGW
jgi:hypothetical protein